MSQAWVPDQSERSSDKLIALAGNEHQNIDRGDPVDDLCQLGQDDTDHEPALSWRGPISFARAYGSTPGIDHDFGTGWGSNGDQRVSLHVELGADDSLLYVYDPTWDEYAVLGTDIPLAAVEEAFAHTLQVGGHLAVEDFRSLVPTVPAVRPSPVPEL